MADREVASPASTPDSDADGILSPDALLPRALPPLQAEANATPPGAVEPPATPPAEPPAPKEHKESKEARDAKEAKDVKEAKEAKEKDAAAAEEPVPLPISIARLVPKLKKSAKLFEEGKKRIPNSTSSLIRVASYDPCPPFIAKGKGPRIWDEDGNEYLDFNLAYGCLINGHAHPQMVKAIQKQAELGFHFASPTELEIEVATLFQKLVPNAERVAFCSNGSDATMNA
ncbi:MAG: aminotransferase class III-fold pyridoxal phosphate-dependent enzyme, partial [Thermoplasmata archaeon]